MSDTAAAPVDGAVLFTRSVIVDVGFAGRMTRATFRTVLVTPRLIVTVIALVVVLASLAATYLSPDPLPGSGVLLLIAAVLAILYPLIFIIGFFQGRKQLRDRLPVGSEYSMAMTESSISLRDPLASVSLSYALYKAVRIHKDVIALVPRKGSRPTIIPGELFTEESLRWLRVRITALS
jgi:hypothetical protein